MKVTYAHRLMLAIALTLFSVMAFHAQAFSAPFTLKTLNKNQPTYTDHQNNLVTVAMIYQPNCSWCKKQGKTLAMAFQQCQSSLNVSLVGTKGSAAQLRKELKYYHKGIPAFIADRKFLRAIGGYQASPTTLIFDNKGELLVKKRGFIPEDKLASVFALLTQKSCQI